MCVTEKASFFQLCSISFILAKLVDCSSHEFCGREASCINGKCRCKGGTVGGGEKCRGDF